MGGGALTSSYRVQVPLLAWRCGSRANERLSLPPPEGAALFQCRASLPHTLLFSIRPFLWTITSALLLLLLLLLLPPPYFQVVALPSPAASPPPLQDSLTQFEKARVRNVAAVRTQLGQTGRWGVGSDETEALGLTPQPLMSCVFTHMPAPRSN